MSNRSERLSWFWVELKRRKVVPILIAYLAASFAIIEFTDITSSKFSIPDSTFNLLYLLAAIGLPLSIILPWYINRKTKEPIIENSTSNEKLPAEDEQDKLHNLPAQLTNFIGREKEIPIVRQLIMEHRLVSIIGAGGCGKTRLAIEVTAQLIQDFKDGVWFVDLAPITSEDLVTNEIAEVLNIPEVPNQPIVETLIEKIKEKKLLIILDNCEHLIKASAEITGKLVKEVPGLQMLVTSREALSITGEQVWRVPSLTLIDPKSIIDLGHAKDSEAVMLFADRARLNNPEFELEPANVNEVATICNKLDGIPLALELVASRTRHMSTQMILERFSDRFDQLSSSDPGISKRQQTLQATIEWSYNLLPEKEKLLFSRLAVFSGGFNIKAAEKICSDDELPEETILDALSRLVDRSLVYTTKDTDQTMRYGMLETIRQYARQMLKLRKDEDLIRKQHLMHFLSLADEAYEEQYESQLKWMNILTAEQDNLLAAVTWSLNNSPDEFIELIANLSWFWIVTSQYQLSKDYHEKAIARSAGDSRTNAKILFGMGTLLWYFGEVDRTKEFYDKSLEISKRSNNLKEQATALAWLGYIQQALLKNKEEGHGYSERSLTMAKKIGKPGLINFCLERY
jgi:predicted ATPase